MSSTRRFVPGPAVALLVWVLATLPLNADPISPSLKEAPKDLKELRALETQVKKVLDKTIACTVGVRVDAAQGSGVIVTEDGYVLTAGHVSGKPDRDVELILPSGKVLKGKTLGQNTAIDSGLIKITEPGKYPFAEMGRSGALHKGQWVIGIGHPGGFRANRTPVVRLGRVLAVNSFVIRTDCTLVGGDSGGPLFDLDGKVVGIHSRIGAASITENLHVPVDTYRDSWDRLAQSESWNDAGGIASAGGKLIYQKKDRLTLDDPSSKLNNGANYKSYPVPLKAGGTYTFDLRSNQFDTFLRLEDPDGKKVAEDDDSGGDVNARIVYRALRDGEYRVIVTSFKPGQSGRFGLSVREAERRAEPLSGKVDVLQAVKLPRQVAGVVINELAADRKPLHVNAVVLAKSGRPAADTEITLRWAGGVDKMKTDAKGVIRWPLARERLNDLVLELPPGTRAFIETTDARGLPSAPGFQHDPTKETVKSAGGEIVKQFEGALSPLDGLDSERKGSYRHVHEIKLSPGANYTFDLESDEFNGFLRLINTAGKTLAEDDDGGGYLNPRIVFSTNNEGTFRLVVTSCGPKRLGHYRLTVRRAETAK
jgi:V8-like Glu-specific endopeptidase